MASEAPFTDFERDTDVRIGIHWEHFITALGIWTYVQPGPATVANAALAFNTTIELVREAAELHPWLYLSDDNDPTKQIIESDGE